ncbi:MAG: hypothetical protein IPK07_14265 [Deltaproteobacteria bacterium]|nr:hypothetical protein [Deltaproteobacteria bacterium]
MHRNKPGLRSDGGRRETAAPPVQALRVKTVLAGEVMQRRALRFRQTDHPPGVGLVPPRATKPLQPSSISSVHATLLARGQRVSRARGPD